MFYVPFKGRTLAERSRRSNAVMQIHRADAVLPFQRDFADFLRPAFGPTSGEESSPFDINLKGCFSDVQAATLETPELILH